MYQICLDHMDADSVLSILPKLVFFDKRDLRKYVEGYKAAGTHSKSKPSPRAAPGLPLLPVELGSGVLGASNQKDRAAADVRLDQQLRRAMQKKPVIECEISPCFELNSFLCVLVRLRPAPNF